ncbi:MAG: class I SAM-dependent methyltransferase, partial [Bacteroidaceae bacterium]|nr:class I SAM-dependent methyltransferase [Bacteroidaceae bacterium]
MQEKLDEYILSHISPENDYLYRLYRATQINLLRPRMASGHLQGQLLRMLCQMIRPQRVLEIGTYSGYSALSMASGMGEDTELVTFEINDEQEDFTRPWLEGSPFPPKINMVVGDIFSILPQMEGKFDLVFIDANKRQYCEYLD